MIRALIYLGSALMVYNIYGFVCFARYVRRLRSWSTGAAVLYFPIVLLVLFLMGYLAVSLFGAPDLIMAGILFGGSIFVFVMYYLLRVVTQRIVESEQLEVELMAAESSGRMKADFLACLSHEMRAPMTVIIGLDEAVLSEGGLSPDSRDKLVKIRQSAHHLLDLVNNILEMNNIETGTLALHSEVFLLSDAVGQVNSLVQTLCEQKGLDYLFYIQDQADGWYRGDVAQIKKVLLSILDNAVKFTDAPGTVRLDILRMGDYGASRTLRIAVTDTGVGIDPEFLPRVFDLFDQKDTSATTSRFGGKLSLALSKHVVTMMGGEIAVQSKPGEGSTFTLTLPLERAEGPNPQPPAAPIDPKVSLANRRVLIAEDIPINTEVLADLLELEHVACEYADNGKSCLELFERSPTGYYDAILMDLRMPVMDGLEATRRIRALSRPDAKTVPILAVTANALESDAKQALAAGMNAHIAKPADADTLYNTLKQAISDRPAKEGGTA